MKKKITALVLLVAVCTALSGCGFGLGCMPSVVWFDTKSNIAKKAEKEFHQPAEVISMDILRVIPADVDYIIRLEDGSEFPGNYSTYRSDILPFAWSQSCVFADTHKRMLECWPEVKKLADDLELRIDEPEITAEEFTTYGRVFLSPIFTLTLKASLKISQPFSWKRTRCMISNGSVAIREPLFMLAVKLGMCL